MSLILTVGFFGFFGVAAGLGWLMEKFDGTKA